MMLRCTTILLMTGTVCAALNSAAGQGLPCGYTVTVLPEIDCGFWQSSGNVIAINNLGEVLLTGTCGDHPRTYLWTGGDTLQILPLPPGTLGFSAWDLNDHGLIVGSADMPPSGGTFRGFIYDRKNGQWTEIATLPGGLWSEVFSVNNANQVCGYRSTGMFEFPRSAFLWTGAFADLGLINGSSTTGVDVNDQGTVSISTGFSVNPGSLGYLWHSDGTLEPIGPVPGGLTSACGRLNNHDWVLVGGMIQQNPLITRGFIRLPGGAFIELPSLSGAFSSGLLSITDAGVIAGHANYAGQQPSRRACIWRDAQPIDLNTLMPPEFGGFLSSARMANNEAIVASGVTGDGDAAVFVLTPNYGIDGDTNCDRLVNVDDLINVILGWGLCAGCNADLTRDGVTDVFDLIEVILHWGTKGGAP